jgi:hypothetical protein
MFKIYLCAKSDMQSCSVSLVTAIETRAEHRFRAVAMLLFYILRKLP